MEEEVEDVEDAGLGEVGVLPVATAAVEQGLTVEQPIVDQPPQPPEDDEDKDVVVVEDKDEM